MHPSFHQLLVLALSAGAQASTITKRGFPANGPTWTSKTLGNTFDPNFPGINRDGGNSGTVNGYKVIAFGDSSGTDKSGNGYFVGNSLAYYGFNDAKDPRNLFDFGANGRPNEALHNSAGDVPLNSGDRVALWPSGALPAVNSTHLMGIASVVNLHDNGNGGFDYTSLGATMYTVQPTAYGPITTRIVDRLFGQNDIPYGTFSNYNAIDGNMYLLAAVDSGVKIARTPASRFSNKLYYEYYIGNGKWSKTAPSASDTSANLFNYTDICGGPNTGDLFYDYYHQTLAVVFMNRCGGDFFITYPTGGSLTGAWSTPLKIAHYDSQAAQGGSLGKHIYSGFAHPEWDTSGKTLLLSWSDTETVVAMSQITWTS